MEEYRFRNDVLWCEETDLRTVAEEHGTPLYAYSKRSIIDHARHIEQAFGALDHLSCYAVKANANREILALLAHEGIGADAGSIGEMKLALAAGFSPARMTFSGVGKRDDEIAFALKNALMSLNAESPEEIEIISGIAVREGVRARILLRVNFDIEPGTHPYITTGRRHNKFGVSHAEAGAILRQAARLPQIDILGIHTHLGSQITEIGTFVAAARGMVDYIGALREQGIGITHLNFGGGFGVQYRDFLTHPLLSPEAGHAEGGLATVGILATVLPVLKESRCTILIQPGRSVVAHAGILLTKVLYKKVTNEKTFVIVDAGMNDLLRPSLYQSYHQIVPVCLADRSKKVVDVVGPLCESGDFLALDRTLQEVERGDLLAVMCTGAYGFVLSSNYNGRPRPAEVMIDGGTVRLIRERESDQDL